MAKAEQLTSDKIQFRARAAFTRLDKPKQFNGEGEPRWECTGLIDPKKPPRKSRTSRSNTPAARIPGCSCPAIRSRAAADRVATSQC